MERCTKVQVLESPNLVLEDLVLNTYWWYDLEQVTYLLQACISSSRAMVMVFFRSCL